MPGNNFVVNYDINVLSADAVAGINSFVAATKKLQNASANFNKLNSQINNIKNRFAALSQKAPTIQIKTADAERKLDRLIGKLTQLERKAKSAGIALGTTTGAGATAGAGATVAGGTGRKTHAVPVTRKPRQSIRSMRHNVLGLTNIDTGGVGAFDFLKGMGIAYGISGIGTMVSNTIKEAVEYDNIMQTAKNILMSHDYAPNFSGRFKGMEHIVRQVGVETKFTAGEVADAAKFLAMAGFNIDDVNKSIRPIADIALVGDTDLGETADVVTNIMTGYGISPDKVRDAADVMTMTFTKSNTTLMEMAEAYKYAGSLLSLNGTSFEEATAALGILGDAGIKGSQAGTTMRTLALNIAKPTKGQAEAWEALGISRYNSDGSLRNLVDIFKDLNEKNLSLDQLGKLFHKTAASGGAALAAHVDKWNEIIELNFMSDGMVGRLADAKKNTIEGLWKQVTSAFTEAGMQAFKELEGPIRDVLNTAIAWLKTPEAVNTIKDIAKDIWDLMKVIGDLTKTIFHLYETFKPLVLLWLKIQAKISVFLIPARYIAAVWDMAKYFLMLSTNIGAATASMIKFKGHDVAFWSRWSNITGKQSAMVTSAAGQTAVGVATMAGTVLGGLLGSKLTPDSMWGPMIGSILGGAALNQIGTWFPAIWGAIKGGFLKVISSTLGRILTIGTGVIGVIGAIGYAIYQHHKVGEESRIAFEKWESSINSINGIDYSELASKTDQYLQIVNNKQLTANESLAAYIALRKEELGLIDAATDKADQDTLFKDKFADTYNPLAKLFKGINNSMQLYNIAENGKSINGKSLISHNNAFTPGGYDFNGISYRSSNHKYNGDADESTGAAIVARSLYGLGASLHEGDPTYKLRDDIGKLIFKSKDLEDYRIAMSQVEGIFNEMTSNIIPGSEYWTVDELGTKSWADVQKSYHFVHGQIDTIREALNYANGPYQAFAKIMNEGATDANMKNFLMASGVDVFNASRFKEWGSDEWLKQMGFWDGEWHAMELKDPQTGKIKEYTAEQARLLLETFQTQTTSIIRMLAPNLQNQMQGFTADYIWKPQITSQYKVGDKKTLEGLTYTWDGKMWNPPSVSTAASLSYSQMESLSKGAGTPTSPVATTTTTADDYDTPYKSSSVTPKQIIVKIENLMNVESVDMSNPNNAAVIEDLRNQMAQALIDVVADFDANANA